MIKRDYNKIIYLQGGLGNQLFQLALHLYLKKREVASKVSPILLVLKAPGLTKRNFDSKTILNQDEIKISKSIFPWIILRKILKKNIYVENNEYTWSEDKFRDILKESHVLGYFQSKKIVDDTYNLLRPRLFRKLTTPTKTFDIAIHIRGTDYLNSNNAIIYETLSSDYYERALELLSVNNTNLNNINVITDDLHYAKKILSKSRHAKNMTFYSGDTSWEALNNLINHRNLIIANSSFSWWGGYIASRELGAKIIMPANWTKNIPTKSTELADVGEYFL